jgi:hypothetical protein
MPHEILNSMRALREDMRQRLSQVPEYRAIIALDRAIEEIHQIMREPMARAEVPPPAPEAISAPVAEAPHPAPTVGRQSAIASAFAETLAAKLDHRPGVRPGPAYTQGMRALGG